MQRVGRHTQVGQIARGSWGGAVASHQLGGLGGAVSSPCVVRGGAPTAQRFPLLSGWPLLTL